MTPAEAIDAARRGELQPVYLVAGEEEHLRDAVVQAVRDAALQGAVPGLNEDQLTAGDVEVDAVVSAARTLPMMGQRRLVVVRALERWDGQGGGEKPSRQRLDRLADYVADPSPSTVLVLIAGKLDKRRRLVATARSSGWLVACEPLSNQDLCQWVEATARQRGHSLQPGVADLIVELAGPELGGVLDALERVCLYVGPGKPVTEDAVTTCIVRLRTATVWQLVDSVGRGDLGAALAALGEVYDPQDRGLRLVGVLAWSARQLLQFEAATRAGLPPRQAAKQAGAPPFKANQLAQRAKRIPRADLERWLEVLTDVDRALKGGSKRPPRAVLEEALVRLCPRGAKRPSTARAAGQSAGRPG